MQASDDALLPRRPASTAGGANTTRNQPRRIILHDADARLLQSRRNAWHEAIPFEEARGYPEAVQRYLGLYSARLPRRKTPASCGASNAKTLQEHLALLPAKAGA
jgi:hypothetical protein